jgi:hypothetical protein
MRDADFRRVTKCLIDNAVSLGEPNERCELFFRRVGCKIKEKSDALNPNGRFLGDSERASKIYVAFGSNRSVTNLNAYGGCNGRYRDAGAGCKRLQKHIAGTGHEPVTASGGMKARLNKRLASSNLA